MAPVILGDTIIQPLIGLGMNENEIKSIKY